MSVLCSYCQKPLVPDSGSMAFLSDGNFHMLCLEKLKANEPINVNANAYFKMKKIIPILHSWVKNFHIDTAYHENCDLCKILQDADVLINNEP